MKNKIIRIWLTVMLTVPCFKSHAQRVSNSVQTTTNLAIEMSMIQVENLTYTDFIGEGNIIQHTASFDILLSDDAVVRSILQFLQTQQVQLLNPKEKSGRQLTFLKLNQLGETIEERQYLNTIVDDISFTTLDATNRSNVKATIRIKAAMVNLVKSGVRAKVPTQTRNFAQSSYFNVTLGNLPTRKVTRISGLSIKPSNPGMINFTIEILATDGADWNQWFLTGAGGIKKEQGTIRLLAPNSKDVLYNLSLMDVEITSYSISPGTPQALSRATIGLRMRSLAVK